MIVSITHFKTLFSEYTRGPTSFIHLLSKPIAANRDIAIHLDDIDKLKEAMASSLKKKSTKLVFYGSHTADKSIQLNHLAYHSKQSVCFVDCQRLVDKYIGETEKNLSKLVAQAESENWILYFDEADALFGKRSEVKEAHDKYANQEVSYLFKRLSQYPGLSILSLSKKSNLESIQYVVEAIMTFR
jgi:SpoVK/Ycf46/Vps4 family AAA+-type ATPase